MKLWNKIKTWWTMRTCHVCGTVHHKSETYKNMFVYDGGFSCPACKDKWYDAIREQRHERRVRAELVALRVKEEARIRFNIERSRGAYRTPNVRVDAEEEEEVEINYNTDGIAEQKL